MHSTETHASVKHPFDEQRDYLEEALFFLLGAPLQPEPRHMAALQTFLIKDQENENRPTTARPAAL